MSDLRRAAWIRISARQLFALIIVLMIASLPTSPVQAQRDTNEPPADFAQLKQRAEALYDRGSYAQALDLYRRADEFDRSPEMVRWTEFRLADLAWRSIDAGNRDQSQLDQSREGLQEFIAQTGRERERDDVWALAQESLGDSYFLATGRSNLGQASPHYAQALEYWADSADIEQARNRYLDIVWRIADRTDDRYTWRPGQHATNLTTLENVIKIARNEAEEARAHYLLGRGLMYSWSGMPRRALRVSEEFELAIKLGTKDLNWYDDALYSYAQWVEERGRVVVAEDGQWTFEPDYIKALKLYHRLVDSFTRSFSQYYENAQRSIGRITGATVSIAVGQPFVPKSIIAFDVSWRNVESIEFALHRVDLTRDLQYEGRDREPSHWLQRIDLEQTSQHRRWTFNPPPAQKHAPGSQQIVLEEPLPVGAYILTANIDGQSRRELVLVTDLAIVTKRTDDRLLVFACDALSGAPVADARISAINRYYDRDENWSGTVYESTTDAQGLCELEIPAHEQRNADHYHADGLLITANADGRQAWNHTYSHWWGWRGNHPNNEWKIYAQTDRPAYRPGETVKFKFTARIDARDGLTTPQGKTVKYAISDARGTKVHESTATLNAYGSAWDEFEVPADAALGEFTIAFMDPDHRDGYLGNATLFRIEEYKLPEFVVTIETPTDEEGQHRQFRVGDTVQATITAQYYSGPPVASATVEVVVTQRPYYRWWKPVRAYPWLHEDDQPWWYWNRRYGEETVSTQTVTTDAQGQAVIEFETPDSHDQDYEYEIEARVTDLSRREIIGTGTVRVTRQSHFANVKVDHALHQPGDTIDVEFEVVDANDNPVQKTGTVTVARRLWQESWLDPAGQVVTQEQMQKLRAEHGFYPPPPGPGDRRPWTPWKQGYEKEFILTTQVTTDEQGRASLSFDAPKTGYYQILWVSEDPPVSPVVSEAHVWVTDRDSAHLGYRSNGIEIILDKDAVRLGAKTPIMLVSPVPDRYVLFTIEGRDLYHHELIHLTGTTKLLELELGDWALPNVYLSATLVSAGELSVDIKDLVVPPVHQFLDITVTPDEETYEPGGEGRVTINATDHEGKGMAAEIALAVFDESVLYIAPSYADDPRQFFYGDRQEQRVLTGSSFDQGRYRHLVKSDADRIRDIRDLWQDIAQAELEGETLRRELGQFAGKAARGRAGGGDAVRVGSRSGSGSIFNDEDQGMMDLSAETAMPFSAPQLPDEQDQSPNIKVRTDFRATALWIPDLATDDSGTTTTTLTYPETLTAWNAVATAATAQAKFGTGEATARTTRPLTIRLQGPRFAVKGDRFVASYIINNNTDERILTSPRFRMFNVQYLGTRVSSGKFERRLAPDQQTIVEANSERRVDIMFAVAQPGEIKFVASVTNPDETLTDGVEMVIPALEHGIDKLIATSGKVAGNEAWVTMNVPAERDKPTTKARITITPSIAMTMLDALPYLTNYPYGCTEQTMSRFLPTIVTLNTLKAQGIDPELIASRAFGGIEQAHVENTQPDGKRDLARIDEMIQASLDRLYDFQHGDGGWGWWKTGPSDDYMTAYVLWGLARAQQNDVEIRADVPDRAARYLAQRLVDHQRDPEMQAWMLHAITAANVDLGSGNLRRAIDTAADNVWQRKDNIGSYARALFALVMHRSGNEDRAGVLAENLANGVTRDDAPDQSVLIRTDDGLNPAVLATVHWGSDGIAWRWTGSQVEATAMAVAALITIDPDNKLIEPAVNWLVKNRRGAQWSNTRDTAIAVLALNDYLSVTGQTLKSVDYEVNLNGRLLGRKRLTREDLLNAPTVFEVPADKLLDGENKFRLLRRSVDGDDADDDTGAMYFAIEIEFFSREEPITAAGNELFIRRDYYRLAPTPTLLGGMKYTRESLDDMDKINSGDRIEVVLTIEPKNNYEYLVFEDLKPAGFEAVQIRSGEPMTIRQLRADAVKREIGDGEIIEFDQRRSFAPGQTQTGHDRFTGAAHGVHQELRDRLVAFFVDRLEQGVWELRYELRAETPGYFHALPAMGHAMYVPEIRANGQELRVEILDDFEPTTPRFERP